MVGLPIFYYYPWSYNPCWVLASSTQLNLASFSEQDNSQPAQVVFNLPCFTIKKFPWDHLLVHSTDLPHRQILIFKEPAVSGCHNILIDPHYTVSFLLRSTLQKFSGEPSPPTSQSFFFTNHKWLSVINSIIYNYFRVTH